METRSRDVDAAGVAASQGVGKAIYFQAGERLASPLDLHARRHT